MLESSLDLRETANMKKNSLDRVIVGILFIVSNLKQLNAFDNVFLKSAYHLYVL